MRSEAHRLPFADVLARSLADPNASSSSTQLTAPPEDLSRPPARIAQEGGDAAPLAVQARRMYAAPTASSSKLRQRSRFACSALLSLGFLLVLGAAPRQVTAILAPGDDPDPARPSVSEAQTAEVNASSSIVTRAEDTDISSDGQDGPNATLVWAQDQLEPSAAPLFPGTASTGADTPPAAETQLTFADLPPTPAQQAASFSESLVLSSGGAYQVLHEPSAPDVGEAPPSSTTEVSPTAAVPVEIISKPATATVTDDGSRSSATEPTESLAPEPTVAQQVTSEEGSRSPAEPKTDLPSDTNSQTSIPSPPSSPSEPAAEPTPTEPANSTLPPVTVNASEPVPNQTDTPVKTGSTNSNSRPAVGNPGPLLAQLKTRWNYASMDCAAVVHRTNPGAKFASSILSEKKDRYMLSPCPTDHGGPGSRGQGQYVIVELCDNIMIDTVVLGNYEFFSRQFKRFRLRAAAKLHAREEEWYDFGTFRARNSRGLQVFEVNSRLNEGDGSTDPDTVIPGYDGEDGPTGQEGNSSDPGGTAQPPPIFTPPSSSLKDARFFRYVRIDFLEHYGSEFYCPVSVLRIYGLTALDEYYRDQEEGGDGGAGAAVSATANNPIVANVVELAEQLDFAYQYAAEGWGHQSGRAAELDEHMLIGDGSAPPVDQGQPASGRVSSPFDDMDKMIDAALAAVEASSNDAASSPGAGERWAPRKAVPSPSPRPLAEDEDVETYKVDVNAGQPHVHVKVVGAGTALGADPVILSSASATCAPGDLERTGETTVVTSSSEGAPQARSSIQVGLPSATSTSQSTAQSTSTAADARSPPVQAEKRNDQGSAPVDISSSSSSSQRNSTVPADTSSAWSSTGHRAANNTLKTVDDEASTTAASANRTLQASPAVMPASSSAASDAAPSPKQNATGSASPTLSSTRASSTITSTSAPAPVASSSEREQPPPRASGAAQPPPPPPPSSGSGGGGGGAGSESIYRTINKRLAALEFNSTLNLAFIEHSQRLLRDSFIRMAERHQGRIDEMVRSLNASNWRQFDLLRRRTQVDLQRALFEAEIRRQQADSERSAMMAQIHLLTEEVLVQKRISLAQLVLILGLFTFVALTRGMRSPQFINSGFGTKFGVVSRPSTPNNAASGGGSPNTESTSSFPGSLLPSTGFLRQRLNRSRRVSAPIPTAASGSGQTTPVTTAQHHHPYQPADRSRLSVVVPAASHNSSLYRLYSGASSPNGSILELADLPRGEHWRERVRSSGTGSVVSFLEDHYVDADPAEMEGEMGSDVTNGRRRSLQSPLHPRPRSISTATTATSTSIRSGSDIKSIGSGRGIMVSSPLHNAREKAPSSVSISVASNDDHDSKSGADSISTQAGSGDVGLSAGAATVGSNEGWIGARSSGKYRKKKRGTSLLGSFGGNKSAESVGTI
ncbi:hypothetical protein V8E36_003726 [Tilletia maclaganii]